mmetsp:Transcript_27974/g.90440  ORF Transcript_27974/g.90440 Transcript_27974/m.90440 type:complete len:244 (+) Transcript_27974:1021-1752(+)
MPEVRSCMSSSSSSSASGASSAPRSSGATSAFRSVVGQSEGDGSILRKPSFVPSVSAEVSMSGLLQARRRQACFLMPGPPYLGLSLQFLQSPQSPRVQPMHVPHRESRARLLPKARSSAAEGAMMPSASCSRMQHSTALQKSFHSWGGMMPALAWSSALSASLGSWRMTSAGAFAREDDAAWLEQLGATVGADAFWHLRSRQDCLRIPCPPYRGLSAQLTHLPQSSRQQALQRPQETVRFRFF